MPSVFGGRTRTSPGSGEGEEELTIDGPAVHLVGGEQEDGHRSVRLTKAIVSVWRGVVKRSQACS